MIPGVFKSATTKLTVWFLATIMILSLSFSVAIYQVSTSEAHNRLERFQLSVQDNSSIFQRPANRSLFDSMVEAENLANNNLAMQLIYTNIFILVIGGAGSYLLARLSLRPLEKAHDTQSRFTSDASHELRTPLAVMKTELEVIIRDKKATDQELREVLISNLEEVDKLTKLSEMLLELSQLDSVKLKLGSVNIQKVTQSVINDYKIPTTRILVKSKKQPIAYGNEMAITDLIKILIDNAIQYSPKDSMISIDIYTKENMACFSITNSGKGISIEKLPHIFERFFRADSSRTKKGDKGYGLGLALAKSIVERHKGELYVTSQPNKETTFYFELPLKTRLQAKNKKQQIQ